MPESMWVSRQLGRPVIKAFNNILAYSLAKLGRPEGSPDRLAVAVAGEDPKAKQMVMELVNDTVDAASLDESCLLRLRRGDDAQRARRCGYGQADSFSSGGIVPRLRAPSNRRPCRPFFPGWRCVSWLWSASHRASAFRLGQTRRHRRDGSLRLDCLRAVPIHNRRSQ